MAEALSVQALCVRRGDKRVLSEVGFEARYGEVSAVLGPNGAGKSTLLRAVMGLLPFTGQVRIDGRPLSELTPLERATRIAFVPQTTLLRSALPVRSVVAQGRYPHRGRLFGLSSADEAAIDEALRIADVQALAGRSFTQLSFGEQRRVLLARGLATEATVLCLDEPTASLDIGHALSLYSLLRDLAQRGRAVVVVLHQLADALSFTDRALLLCDGCPVTSGPTKQVITEETVRQVYGVTMRQSLATTFTL